MADLLIYWRDYQQNWIRQFAGHRAHHWHSNAQVIGTLQAGDHLWLVTSGKCIRHEVEQAGFLLAIWQVKKVVENPDDDPAYPQEDYRYRIIANREESINLDEPVLVDHILRPARASKAVSIGRFLQGPRKLNDQTLRLLRAAAGPKLALHWLKGKQ